MARRILAAFVVVGAALTLIPARLSGEPTTTGPTTTAPKARPPTPMRPNPQAVYPRRPGARYRDIEAPPHGSVTLGAKHTIARSTIEPRRTLPPRWRPSRVSDARHRGLVDGYTPVSTDTPGDVLHVVVREKDGIGMPLLCSATAVSDGAVLIPFNDGANPPLPVRKPTPGTTTTGAADPGTFDLHLYLPIGARRGRIYLACQLALFLGMTEGLSTRAVWAIDV